ncbi:hypothetical protein ACWFRF_20715 [Nocardia sp. NPDC055165]
MASDRDTLTDLIFWEFDRGNTEPYELAGALLAKGVRPPAQVITDPAQLDALPVDSIVVDHHGAGWQMTDRDYDGTAIWEYRTTARTSAGLLAAGARVHLVHVPTEEVDRG